jgi:hypothetical protein
MAGDLQEPGPGPDTTMEDLRPLNTPQWARGERELWVDLFTGIKELLIAATLTEHEGLGHHHYPENQLREDIRLAGELADAAMMEVSYRFYLHPHAPRQREPRPRIPDAAAIALDRLTAAAAARNNKSSRGKRKGKR